MMYTAPFVVDGQGFYTKEISINDSPNRMLITNVSVLEEIARETSSAVVCKGRYIGPVERTQMASTFDKPLHIRIKSKEKNQLIKATELVCEIIDQKEGEAFQGKVTVGLVPKDMNFNMRRRILGDNNVNLKYINRVSGGTKLQLRGRAGSHIDPMSVYFVSNTAIMMRKAKKLVEGLLKKLNKDYQTFLKEKELNLKQQKEQQQMMNMNPQMRAMNMPFQTKQSKRRATFDGFERDYHPNLYDYNPGNINMYKNNVRVIKDMIQQTYDDDEFEEMKIKHETNDVEADGFSLFLNKGMIQQKLSEEDKKEMLDSLFS